VFGLVRVLIGPQDQFRHVGPDVVSLVVMVMIITATVSTYLIEHSHRIASLAVGALSESAGDPDRSTALVRGQPAPIVLVGCFRFGSSLVHELRQAAIDFSVVDFSQDVNERLNRLGVPTVYGDVSHLDTLAHAGLERARILVASIPDDFLRGTDNRRMLDMLRRVNPTAKIVVTSDSIQTAQRLYEAGADYVVVPRVLVARHLLEVIAEIGGGLLDDRRKLEREHLAKRVEVVP
jgi:DNA-binding NarL/FixJ family response regulator